MSQGWLATGLGRKGQISLGCEKIDKQILIIISFATS